MKITKYAQSCFLLETKGKRILIDPGKLDYSEDFTYDYWKHIDTILLTHRHHDHTWEEGLVVIIKNNSSVKIFCNDEVASKLEIPYELVKVGDVIDLDGIKIEVVKAVHGYIPPMGPNGIKLNNGYIVDDGTTRVYHCGDTICFENNFKADVVLVPICGHGVVMEPKVAVEFAKAINPKLTIAMHYDAPMHQMGTETFEREAKEADLNYKILNRGESIMIGE